MIGVAVVFGGALAAWIASLALFWRIFRSWQYLVDAMARCPAEVAHAARWPVLSVFEDPGAPDLPRGQMMALQGRVFIHDLPNSAPDDARRHARRFRRAVLGLTVLLTAMILGVTYLEPALLGVARVFYAGLIAWALLHLAMMWRWRAVGVA